MPTPASDKTRFTGTLRRHYRLDIAASVMAALYHNDSNTKPLEAARKALNAADCLINLLEPIQAQIQSSKELADVSRVIQDAAKKAVEKRVGEFRAEQKKYIKALETATNAR